MELTRNTFANYLLLIFLLILLNNEVVSQPKNLQSVVGTNGMVTTAHPLASEAALDILKKGGNAVDAAVAAAFSIGVVEPDGSGIGGGGCMLVYLKKENKSYYINFYQKASEKVDEINYKRKEGINAKTALVPGSVSGLTTALKNFGTLDLSEVMSYAIRYARDGFKIDNTLATIILDNFEVIEQYPSTKKLFMPNDFPLMEDDSLKQPELANTLEIIAAKGAKGFYEGEIAKYISEGIEAEGGRITLDDLKNYKTEITEPLTGTYRDYKIVSADVPQAGVTLIETMNLIENINFNQLGYYTTSAQTLHIMAEIFLRSYADRFEYVGDPNFSEIPIDVLLSKEYAKDRYDMISPDSTDNSGYRKSKAGEVEEFREGYGFYLEQNFEKDDFNDQEKSAHTTHISVVDKEGNMVSLTQTLGTFFGSGYSVMGVLLNSSLINFSTKVEVNKLAPGKTPRSTICPTFLIKDEKPFLCLGSPGGGRIISTLAEIIVSIVDFGMTAESANQAPRFHCQVNDDYLSLENRFPQSVVDKLIEKGHNVKILGDYDLFFGGAQFIIIDSQNNKLFGTADRRRGGVAVGY